MTRARLAFLVLALFTAAEYGVLVGWGGSTLSAASGGLVVFDLRVTGYSPDEARVFLAALSPEGRQFYLGPVRVLDTVFPIAYTLCLCIAIWYRSLGLPHWLRAALTGLGVGYGALDLTENVYLAKILRAGPEALDEKLVHLASALTIGKFIIAALGLIVFFILLVRRRPAA